MAVWFYVKNGLASMKTRREDVALVRLAVTSPVLAARLFELSETIHGGERDVEVRVDVTEAAEWYAERLNNIAMRSILVIDQRGRCFIEGRMCRMNETKGVDLREPFDTVTVPVTEVIAFAHRPCDHYCVGNDGVSLPLFAAAVNAAKAQEEGHPASGEPAVVVDVEIRDCGYGFSACAVMSDGSRAFHTNHLCATAEQASREVAVRVGGAVGQRRMHA
ncbi:hypothetical protein AB7849_15495 [Rhodanobacter sp. 115]|uniref:hypothetical protein n=1 Tax=Rhodanobacter sp. FW021-MT20 TaxID=1162282 RepID=UPI0034E4779B